MAPTIPSVILGLDSQPQAPTEPGEIVTHYTGSPTLLALDFIGLISSPCDSVTSFFSPALANDPLAGTDDTSVNV